MANVNPSVELEHKLLGRCQLVRTEGVVWVVRKNDTGAEFRIPPSRRKDFLPLAQHPGNSPTHLGASKGTAEEDLRTEPQGNMANVNPLVELEHKLLGRCQLVRTEGVVWVVRTIDTRAEFFIPPGRRHEFRRLSDHSGEKPKQPGRPKGTAVQSATVTDCGTRLEKGHPNLPPLPTFRGIPAIRDMDRTTPVLWQELERWVHEDELLRERTLTFLRSVLNARVSGRKLSADEATDAWLLLDHAVYHGFRIPKECMESDENASSTCQVADHNTVARGGAIPDRFGSSPTNHDEISKSERDNRGDWPLSERPTTARFSPVITESTHWASVPAVVDSGAVALRRLRQMTESLRIGLPPRSIDERSVAVGLEYLSGLAAQFVNKVAEGGAAMVVRGGYGHGKTFTLGVIEEFATDNGFVVLSPEIDTAENKLDRPHQIFRSLMASLRLPGVTKKGGHILLDKATEFVQANGPSADNDCRRAQLRRRWLTEQLECEPLAWLLSDPFVRDKPELAALFCGESVSITKARSCHILPSCARDWPRLYAGTQGDVATYLLSGLGRLCRLLGYEGLVLQLDEMEKWQELDWNAQTRAGNLLGGLIWGATTPDGQRDCRCQIMRYSQRLRWDGCDHPPCLTHSGLYGGFPFSTKSRCCLGLVIAMTPRGKGPEEEWTKFGSLDIVDLPRFGPTDFKDCFEKLRLLYIRAYELAANVPPAVLERAYTEWTNSDDYSPRSGVVAIVQSLDRWRESLSS